MKKKLPRKTERRKEERALQSFLRIGVSDWECQRASDPAALGGLKVVDEGRAALRSRPRAAAEPAEPAGPALLRRRMTK